MNKCDEANRSGINPEESGEWFEVHSSAVTNTNPKSVVHVTICTDKICPNISNAQFRNEVMRARDAGVSLIEERIAAVAR